jgi:hypothetical protein
MRKVAVLILVLFAAIAPNAAASHVACGDVLTADTTFDSDLYCGPDPVALVVGADGIRIDLNGHEVYTPVGVGLDNRGGYDNVTVVNGTLGGAPSVLLVGADRNTFDGVALVGEAGPWIEDSDDTRIVRSRLGGALGGLTIKDSDGTVLDDLDVYSQTGGEVIRVLPGSDGTSITRLVFLQDTPTSCCLSGRAIQVDGGTSGTTIADNVIAGLPWGGIFVEEGATDVTITGNSVSGSHDGSGIFVRTPSASVGSNTSNDNGYFGIYAAPGVTDLGGNKASGNGYSFPDGAPADADCRGVVCNAPSSVFSGFRKPIAGDGSSRFRLGRAIPVRFGVTDAAGDPVPTADPSLSIAKVVNGVVGSYGPAKSANGKGVRYRPRNGTYAFVLKTRGLSAGTWSLRVTLADGTTHDVRIALR